MRIHCNKIKTFHIIEVIPVNIDTPFDDLYQKRNIVNESVMLESRLDEYNSINFITSFSIKAINYVDDVIDCFDTILLIKLIALY